MKDKKGENIEKNLKQRVRKLIINLIILLVLSIHIYWHQHTDACKGYVAGGYICGIHQGWNIEPNIIGILGYIIFCIINYLLRKKRFIIKLLFSISILLLIVCSWDLFMNNGHILRGIYNKVECKVNTVYEDVTQQEDAQLLPEWEDNNKTDFDSMAKPVIYLYPEKNGAEISVDLVVKEGNELTFTYPKYENGWKVVADRDGTIYKDGKEYNYLYWEGITKNMGFNPQYCIKGSETAPFLENKLEELGLTRKEANEFIVYWLPKMESNAYNLISFDTEEYEKEWGLKIEPTPDKVIRVYMSWKESSEYEEIEEPIVITPMRKGFTVVEWGGTQINN